MGVFRRSGHSGKAARAKTVIANGCHIFGEVTLDGDLHLDGTLDGTISAINVSVGKLGQLKGKISAKHVTLAGRVEGNIYCDLLELLDGCNVYGEVHCHDLVVEKGAKFVGTTKEGIVRAEGAVQTSAPLLPHDQATQALIEQQK
jgi:cytoskeletal protein CcmA (bactofilin family)